MKLGVSINYWDSGELLESCIANIRPLADHLSIVFQSKSNYGNDWSRFDNEALGRIAKQKLAEDIIRCERTEVDVQFPDASDELKAKLKNMGSIHENYKRNVGLYSARKAGCTHYMSMDADEYYIAEQLNRVKFLMEANPDNQYDAAFCKLQTYYKEPIYRLDPPEDYYVAIMYKITPETEFSPKHEVPVLVDPTRRCNTDNPLILHRIECEMHHMSYVRAALMRKFNNSSVKASFNEDNLKLCIDHYNKWQYPQKALCLRSDGLYHHNIIKTDNIFNINL